MNPATPLYIAAIDFWPPSLNALETAIRFAVQFGGKVLAVHVVEKGFHYPEECSVRPESLLEDVTAALNRLIEPTRARGVEIDCEVREGDVLVNLALAKKAHGATMIVAGIREGRFLEDVFIGTNTMRLMKSTEIPALVVDNATIGSHINEVLIAINFRVAINGILQFMERLGGPMGEVARLVVWMTPEEHEADVIPRVEAASEKLEALGFEEVTYQLISSETPGEAFLSVLRFDADNVDLVLLEHPDMAAAGRLTLGSFVEQVATKGGKPVLCMPRIG